MSRDATPSSAASVPPQPDDELARILDAFLADVEAGRPADPDRLLVEHPSLADRLRSYLPLLGLGGPFDGSMPDPLNPLPDVAGSAQTAIWPGAFSQPDARPDGPRAGAAVRYFGDYEIAGEIARGGMGIVYRARQVSLNRPVALKLLLHGVLASEEERRRFRFEAEAAANLDHPSIVPIYEVGEHDGLAYFAMKLVEGDSLAGLLPRFVEDPRAAARLVADVARAVHHAHRRGVLHRDLKPSNVLIDAAGAPYVVDFGLARRAGVDTDQTRSDAVLGTPAYMAPEQAAGHRRAITTATDVYGLGAILYALLTRRAPFRGDSVLDTIEQVKTRSPEPPSAVNHRIDRDLQTICLKCLEKEPGRRYGSAEALATDLDRWIRGEPIAARPSGLLERAWRWCRRNPTVASLSTALALLLIAAVSGLAISRAAIDTQRRRAEANFRKARDAVDQMLTEVGRTTLADVPQMESVRRALLEKALAFYQGVLDERGGDPIIRLETGRAYRLVGDIRRRLGELEVADSAYLRSISLLDALALDRPRDAEPRDELGRALRARGDLLSMVGRLAEAEQSYRRGMAIMERLEAEFPTVDAHRKQLATTCNNMAGHLLQIGRLDEAESVFRRLLKIHQRRLATGVNDAELQSDLGGALNNLALVRKDRGDEEQARTLLEQAIRHQQAALSARPRDPTYRRFLRNHYENLAMALNGLGRREEAIGAAGQIITLGEALAAEFPFMPEFREELAGSHANLGLMLLGAGRLDEAERATRRGLELFTALATEHPGLSRYRRDVSNLYGNLGHVLRDEGRLGEAEAAYDEALKRSIALVAEAPESDLFRASLPGRLGNLRRLLAGWPVPRLQHPTRTVTLVRAAIDLVPEDGTAWAAMGAVSYRAGDWQGAVAALGRTIELRRGGDGPDWFLLAMAHFHLGDQDEARAWYDKAVAWYEADAAKSRPWSRLREEAEGVLRSTGDACPQTIERRTTAP